VDGEWDEALMRCATECIATDCIDGVQRLEPGPPGLLSYASSKEDDKQALRPAVPYDVRGRTVGTVTMGRRRWRGSSRCRGLAEPHGVKRRRGKRPPRRCNSIRPATAGSPVLLSTARTSDALRLDE
jgi:hypothetical protein